MNRIYRAAQSGFTLIELMIVLTILGLIALIAAPIFGDYAIRARVAEVNNTFGPVKTAIDLSYAEKGALPSSLADVPLAPSQTATDYATDVVEKLEIGTGGRVTITLQTNTELGDASGKTVIYKPDILTNGSLRWGLYEDTPAVEDDTNTPNVDESQPAITDGSTVPANLLP